MWYKILLLLIALYLHCTSYEAVATQNKQNQSTILRNYTQGPNNDYDLNILLDGVGDVKFSGDPSCISVYGPAFPVITGKLNSGGTPVFHAVVAASRIDDWKIIAGAHTVMFHPEDGASPLSGRNRFILNSVRWAGAGSNYYNKIAILVDYSSDDNSLVNFLKQNGYSPQRITLQELQSTEQLREYGVIIVTRNFHADKALILKKYLERENWSGGILVGLTSWAYSYFEDIPGHFGENYPGNILSTEFGLAWHRDSYAGPTTPSDLYSTNTALLSGTRVLEGWTKVKEYLLTGQLNSDQSLTQFVDIFEAGIDLIPSNDHFWQENNFYEDALNFTRVNKQPIPSKDKPVVDPYDKFVLRIFNSLSKSALKPHDVKAHPSSEIFPGKVALQKSEPKSSDEEIVSIKINVKKGQFLPKNGSMPQKVQYKSKAKDSIEVNKKFPLWYSTGLYAPAGSVITATIKSDSSDNITDLSHFVVQIGTHSDDISGHNQWPRMPKILSRKNFANDEVVLASPYGGLLYVLIPESAVSNQNQERTYQVNVTGGVQAPFFKLKETSLGDWRNKLRHSSGPWAEFVTDNIVLSVPSSSVRTLEDPEELLLFWDQVMNAIADLAAIPRERDRQERIVSDIAIATGNTHNGYPIMFSLEQGDLAVNLAKLRQEGTWEHFRELGHNHQQNDWTFDGTVPVTANLFTLYVLNTVCGIHTEQTRVELTPEYYKKSVSDYIAGGQKFDTWKRSRYLALMFYIQLQKEFGWGAYKKVFAAYHKIIEHPKNDQEKIDLWLVMFSTVVKQDLTLFFTSWGIPISSNASDLISHLPNSGLLISDLLKD